MTFACRSAARWVGEVGWQGNPLLLVAVSFELAVTAVFLFVPAVAATLGHAPPTTIGGTVALLAAAAVIAADAVDKTARRRWFHGTPNGPPERAGTTLARQRRRGSRVTSATPRA